MPAVAGTWTRLSCLRPEEGQELAKRCNIPAPLGQLLTVYLHQDRFGKAISTGELGRGLGAREHPADGQGVVTNSL